MGKARWHRVRMAADRTLFCAALFYAVGCASPPNGPIEIPRALESTGILYIDVMRYEAGQMVVRRLIISSRTYAVRFKPGIDREAQFGPISIVPKERMRAIWPAADDIARSSPELTETGVYDKLSPTNALVICVEGRERAGNYVVFWPLGKEPADLKVRRLVNLLHEVDRSDVHSKFSPFRVGG